MKKIILTAFMAGAMLAVQAQDTPTKTSSKTDMEVSTQMRQDLQLNDNQYQQMQTVNQRKMERRREIESMYASDPATREIKMTEADKAADTELSEILSDQQFKAYLELQGRSDVSELQAVPVESSMDVNTTTTPKTKIKGSEMKMKDGSDKMKVEGDKLKIEQEGTKTKVDGKKMKMESKTGELKVDGDEEKFKSDDVKFKSEPGETKLKDGDAKMKAKDDKVKIESGDKKVKIEDDKTLIKSKDSKYKVKK